MTNARSIKSAARIGLSLSTKEVSLLALNTTPVSQCLDKKLLIFGYEIPDLLAIFLLLSVLNFTFGSTGMKLYLVWLPTLTLALTLRLGKRGKPDNYLLHLVRFQTQPKLLSAFQDATHFQTPPRLHSKKEGAV